MKTKNPTSIRPFGQSSLRSSFLSKPSGDDVGGVLKPPKRPVSLAEFLDRKLVKTAAKTIKEKQSSFSSIGFGGKGSEGKTDDAGVGLILNEAAFKRFNCPVKEEADVRMEKDGDCDEFLSKFGGTSRVLRKRKNPFGHSLGDGEKDAAANSLVVLGDDPKPRPKRRGFKSNNERDKPLYNHYANGHGWWDCDREGVDSEEVGHKEVWEGVGSTTVGGLEWH
uniref:Uncharacterized protein n=1 Tax=Ananas comosus var. bracteatus TaxID=296719 RepID=A0A6V7QLF5_ANACO|nr:unnamed protein product [Ananas comosus var. bracteatus]